MPIVLNGEATATPSVLDNILNAIGFIMKLSGDMLTYMAENPVLVIYLAVGFISIGLAVFARVRRTAKG